MNDWDALVSKSICTHLKQVKLTISFICCIWYVLQLDKTEIRLAPFTLSWWTNVLRFPWLTTKGRGIRSLQYFMMDILCFFNIKYNVFMPSKSFVIKHVCLWNYCQKHTKEIYMPDMWFEIRKICFQEGHIQRFLKQDSGPCITARACLRSFPVQPSLEWACIEGTRMTEKPKCKQRFCWPS